MTCEIHDYRDSAHAHAHVMRVIASCFGSRLACDIETNSSRTLHNFTLWLLHQKEYTIYQIADIKPKKNPLNVSRLELSIKSMVKISISHRYYFAIMRDSIILEHTYQRRDNMKH